MSVRGGRAHGGGHVAAAPAALPRGARRPGRAAILALALSALMLVPAFPVLAQSSSDPWWGPTDVATPTQGWAVRVPVVIENDRAFTIQDQAVAVDVDFGALLVAAGWTNRTAGTEATLRAFTLDVDSIRVVEYQAGFTGGPIDGPRTLPTPHAFYPAPFTAAHHRDFDPARNPAGTVLFYLKGALEPGNKRYYYVYANPLEYGKTPPAAATLSQMAPLEAYLSASSGNVYYGFEPQQTARQHLLHVMTLSPRSFARVEIDQYALGRYVPVPPTDSQPNPFFVGNGFDTQFFVPANTKYRITADAPIVVAATGPRDANGVYAEAYGYVPAVNGSFAGHDFWVFGTLASVTAYRAAGAGPSVKLNVVVPSNPAANPPGATMTSVDTARAVAIASGFWNHVTTTGGDVLLSYGPAIPGASPFPPQTIPALTGAPVGDDFLAALPSDGGFLRICAQEPVSLRIVDTARPSTQVPFTTRGGATPTGPIDTTSPILVEPSVGCSTFNATPATPTNVLEIYSIKAEGKAAPGLFRVTAGSGARQNAALTRQPVGNAGGDRGTDFYVSGNVGVFAYFNDTRVSTTFERLKNNQLSLLNGTAFAIGEDGFQTLPASPVPDGTGRYHVTSNKPIGVVALDDVVAGYETSPPGRPLAPKTVVGAAEFRGPLVELRSREKDGRQDFRSAGPGSPVTFPLEVANLGRWLAGSNLPDEITVSCTGPVGWEVDGCSRSVNLGSDQAERVDVVITPPADAVSASASVNATFQVVAKSRSGVTSEFKLIVFVENRYGVGMWFDVPNGAKTIDPPVGVEPGATKAYKIVVKNTGTVTDTYNLSVTPEPRPGWQQTLLLRGEPVSQLSLAAGEIETNLTFEVTAPNAETAQQNLVSVHAESVQNPLAADVVNTATRIRPKISVHMVVDPGTQIAEPNASALFDLTVNNSGNDNFDILLALEGLLPKGWSARLGVSDFILPPGTNLTVPLRVTPPGDARAGDLATVKVKAEVDAGTGGQTIPGDQVSAVVVVRKVHDLAVPSLADATALPGTDLHYVLPLTNHGNGNDVVEILPGAATPSWKVDADVATLALDVGGSDDLPLTIHVPDRTPPGLVNFTFTLRLSRETTQNVTIPIDVLEAAIVQLRGLDPTLALAPGRARTLQLTAVNTGNVAGAFRFNATAPDGWTLAFSPPQAHLAPGDSVPVTLVVNASRAAGDGAYPVALSTALGDKAAGPAQRANATLARPQLYLAKVEPQGTVAAGELILVTATVGNKGAIEAENVSVELQVDGQPVDQVTLSRIGVGDSKIATLHWLATKRTSDIRVVLDPRQDVVEPTREQHDASVQFASKLPIPAPQAPLAFALAFALALALRRRFD